MKKAICTIIVSICISFFLLPSMVYAKDDSKTFLFELLSDGKDTVEVKKGDVITINFRLKRTDLGENYTMYGMQNEIRYDKNFFELVKDGIEANEGIVTKEIDTVERYRECYMNYLSMSGGSQWEADTLVGRMQLKVIGNSGVSQITSQDCLVSLPDGSGSYNCNTNKVMAIINTECIVSFDTNGGNKIPDQIVQYGEKIKKPENPEREGLIFSGWYKDIKLSEEWDFDNDVVENNMTLYAKWEEKKVDLEEPEWKWIIFLVVIVLISYWIYKKRVKNNENEN